MRKDSWFRGPLLSALFFALLIGNAPVFGQPNTGNPSGGGGGGQCPPGMDLIFDGAYTCVDSSDLAQASHRDIPCSVRAKTLALMAIPVVGLPVPYGMTFAAFAAWYFWDCL